jgi:Zn-finger nucleic acid-binding protein
MAETATLICPRCQREMRTYERNGGVVDQCGECRGVFLDRGELERLLDAESGSRAHDRGHDRDEHDRDDERDERHGKRRGRASTCSRACSAASSR